MVSIALCGTAVAQPRSTRQDGTPLPVSCTAPEVDNLSTYYNGFEFVGFAAGGMTGSVTCQESGWDTATFQVGTLPYFNDAFNDYPDFVGVQPFGNVFDLSTPGFEGQSVLWMFWQAQYVTLSPWYGYEPKGLMLARLEGFALGSQGLPLDGNTTFISQNGKVVWTAEDYFIDPYTYTGEFLCFGDDAEGNWGFLGELVDQEASGGAACEYTPITAVPAPGTLGLLGVGLAALWAARRRAASA
jgi:hypothetical protein